jgi:hypothetical protein
MTLNVLYCSGKIITDAALKKDMKIFPKILISVLMSMYCTFPENYTFAEKLGWADPRYVLMCMS